MKNAKTIEVTVAPDGGLSVDAAGFSGPGCGKATAFLEEALGRVSSKRLKPEHSARAANPERRRIGR